MKTIILQTINKFNLLQTKDKIVVAVSGGPDSVALWHFFTQIKQDFHLQLHLVHIDHQLRGKESLADAQFVRQLAHKYNEPATIETRDVAAYASQNKLSIHEAARNLRYQILFQTAKNIGANKIAIAHNADDQAETILMRFLRGSGPEGLRAIQPKKGKVIRPLLETTRQQIMEFIEDNHLTFRTDSSNLKTQYLRNKLRHELLPVLIKEYNPNLKKNLIQLANILREEETFWNEYLPMQLKKVLVAQNPEQITLNVRKLKDLPLALQRRLCRQAICNIKGDLQAITYTHIEQILNAIGEESGEKHFSLPQSLEVIKSYDRLEFKQTPPHSPSPLLNQKYPLKIPGYTEIRELNLHIDAKLLPIEKIHQNDYKNAPANVCYLDFDQINHPLYIRSRRHGDKFTPYGMTGSKKLKDFFIDNKTPRGLRDSIPLLVEDNDIVWAIGMRTAEKAKITTATKQVLYLKAEKTSHKD